MFKTESKPLIAGVLRRSIGSGGAAATARAHGFSPGEREAVRAARRDGRDVNDRAIDQVVERLLRELTW
jgi:hypothetical protein